MKKFIFLALVFISSLGFSQEYHSNKKVEISETTATITTNCSTNDGSTNGLVIKDSDGTIVEKINTDGFYQIRYRDEYAGGAWLPASGGAAPDLVNVTIGGVAIQSYAFDGGATEERLANHFELAHDLPFTEINDGTYKIEVHTHFRPSTNTAGVVKWFFDWTYTPEGGAPISMTPISYTYTIEINQQYYQFIGGIELPVPAGGFGIGGVITFNTRRTPNDAQDTYASDVIFIKTALHVPIDGNGSRQRYVK